MRGKIALIRTRDMMDIIVLERLGFRINKKGAIRDSGEFLSFIKPYSAAL
jgi:hypothetical protein